MDVRNVYNDIISQINVATSKYIKSCEIQKSPRNLILTKRYLKEHELVAVPFDKGVGICLMKSETYKKMLNDILRLDQFEKLEKQRKNSRDVVLKEEERINNALAELKANGKISEELFLELKSCGEPACLYGLAKVHKQVVPLRPMLSIPGSPNCNIAEKLQSGVPEAKSQCSTKKISNQLKDIKLAEG